MKPKKTAIAILMLALMAFAAHADTHLNELMCAAWDGNTAEVRRLIEAGADVNAKNEEDETALMYAAEADAVDALRLLLASGADVNAKTHSGETALMYAAEGGYAAKGGYVASVKLLLEAGADVSAQDNDGKTALMIAERRQYPKVVELLEAAARPPFSKEDVAAYIARAGNDGIWREGRSSVLVERNKPATEYELDKIWDGDLATAWVEGVVGAGIGEYVTIGVQFPQLSFKKITSNVKIKGKLRMNNGFCRSEKLFKDNNRVKRALLTVYAVPLRAAKSGTTVLDPGPIKLKEFEIAVADTSGLQVFDFDAEILPRADVDGDGTVALFLRLTILDVYRGERYDDTCISELHATAEIAR